MTVTRAVAIVNAFAANMAFDRFSFDMADVRLPTLVSSDAVPILNWKGWLVVGVDARNFRRAVVDSAEALPVVARILRGGADALGPCRDTLAAMVLRERRSMSIGMASAKLVPTNWRYTCVVQGLKLWRTYC